MAECLSFHVRSQLLFIPSKVSDLDVSFQPEQDSTHEKSKKPARSETAGPLGCLLSWGRNMGLLVPNERKEGDRIFSRVCGDRTREMASN